MNKHATIGETLRRIRHVALDMDGTIYKGATLFPWTSPFLAQIRQLGVGYTFLTNNPSKSAADYLAHLAKMGLTVAPDQLHTSTHATIHYLRQHLPAARRLFLLGTPSMITDFTRAGFESTADDAGDEPDAVIVAFDPTLTFSRLGRAAWWIKAGKPYIATNPDRVCPTDLPTILPDCAAICAALQQAAGRAPDMVLGKPDPSMLDGILHRHALRPAEVAMIGDRLYTDMMMAHHAGAIGVLVLSGEGTLADAQVANPAPHVVVPTLAEFGRLLTESRRSVTAP